MSIICGIDASITGTAVALGDGTDDNLKVQRFPGGESDGGDVCNRFKRYERIIGNVLKPIEESKPFAIFLENYAFGVGTSYTIEFGALLRWHLMDMTQRFYEVAPATLKKFVAGAGNAKKEQMLLQVYKHWGQSFPTNDHADAFGLYRLGLCAAGMADPKNAAQREAVTKVIGRDLLLDAIGSSRNEAAGGIMS